MIKRRLRPSIAALLVLCFGVLGIGSAHAATPFLIWERGKVQNIVLGGSTTAAVWNINLVSSTGQSYSFSKSSPNPKKYIVYSIDLPTNIPLGSYQVVASDAAGDKSTVAAVSVIARTYYSLTSIPNDLRTLFVLFTFFTATFGVMRSRKYSMISYQRTLRFKPPVETDEETSEEVRPTLANVFLPFYRFRQRREANLNTSLLKFVVQRDGEVIHKLSPALWATMPIISFLLAAAVAVTMQGHHPLPQMSVVAYFVFVLIGSFDAFSGVTAATGLFISQLIFGDIDSVRAFLLFCTFIAPWFVASLLGSLYYMTLRIDVWGALRKASVRTKTVVTLLLISLVAGASVYATTIALQSMSIQIAVPRAFFWPLAVTSAALAFIKNLLDFFFDAKIVKKKSSLTTKIETLYIARVLSPGTSLVILLGVIGLSFVWTQSMAMSLVVAAVTALPFAALYLAFPYRFFAKFKPLPRNVLLEAVVMGAFTFIVFMALNHLPLDVVEKSKTFILLALIPLILHAIYSLVEDSIDRAHEAGLGQIERESEDENEEVDA